MKSVSVGGIPTTSAEAIAASFSSAPIKTTRKTTPVYLHSGIPFGRKNLDITAADRDVPPPWKTTTTYFPIASAVVVLASLAANVVYFFL